MTAKTQIGRSMIEMPGILAIIGVLSLLTMWGFRTAIAKNCANTLLSEGQQRARTLYTQRILQRPFSLAEYTNNTLGSCGTFDTTPVTNLAGELGLVVNDVSPAICQELIQKITETSPLRAVVDIDEPGVELQKEDCEDIEDIALIYNQDLGNGQPCETADDCETVCALCQENMCTHECEEPEEDVECENHNQCKEDFGVCGGCSDEGICEFACEPVDWLQSNGSGTLTISSIVDSQAKNNFQLDTTISTSAPATSRQLMGFSGAYTDYFGLSASNKIQCGGGSLTTNVTATPGEIFRVQLFRNAKGKGGATMTVFSEGGAQLASVHDDTADIGWRGASLHLFGLGYAYATRVLRIHDMQVRMDGTLKAYFVPVISPEEKACMYEKLTDKLYCSTNLEAGYIQ